MINAIKQFAQHTPDAIAIEGDNLALGYRSLLSEAEALKRYFLSENMHCIALLMENCPAWVVFDLAARMAGITLVPVPTFFSREQIHHCLTDAGVEVLITNQIALSGEVLPESRLHPMQSVAGQSCWQAVLQETSITNKPGIHVRSRPSPDISKITYTSGTTGTPKGVCLSEKMMDEVAHSLSEATEITTSDRHLCLLPLSVLLENIGGIYAPLLAGACCLVPPLEKTGMSGSSQFDARNVIHTIHSTGATSIILLPQMLQEIVLEVEKGIPLPKQLRFIAAGGAPIPVRLLDKARALGLPVYEGYGLSECASVVAVNTRKNNRSGSVGKLLPHVRIKFSDEGEIMLSGNIFNGYINHAPHHNEWFASGDIGHMDNEGYLYLSGRKKNCFITGYGRNVAPEWIESELTMHASIAQAAVFGEARPYNIAIIVPENDKSGKISQDKDKISAAIEEANRELPDYARISDWIFAEEPFSLENRQLTATGRLRRDAIRSDYNERINQLYQGNETCPERRHHAVL